MGVFENYTPGAMNPLAPCYRLSSLSLSQAPGISKQDVLSIALGT